MRMILLSLALMGMLIPAAVFAGKAEAAQTKIIVRAKSKDAKFIGTSVGGAMVVIKDSATGEVLAKGLTEGTTGDTNRIMKEPWKRGVALSDPSAAKFETAIDIAEPRFVTIEVSAPYNRPQAMIKSSAQVWLIPGRDITGDGIMIEVPGLSVDLVSPSANENIRLQAGRAAVTIKATAQMI
jgi:hypothetical protein